MTSCSKMENIQEQEDFNKKVDEYSTELIKATKIITAENYRLYNSFSEEYNQTLTRNKDIDYKTEMYAKSILQSTKGAGIELLKSLNISSDEIATLSDDEIMTLSLLVYAESKKSTNQTRGGIITDEPFLNCAMTALGITSVTELIDGGITRLATRQGAKAALKTIAKAAGRTLSWVGWGLAVTDFVTCMW